MANITSKPELKNYIMHRLGYPVIQVEIDTNIDGQMDMVIDETIQDYQELNSSEGNYLHYTSILVSAGVGEYHLSGHNIEAVYDLDLAMDLYGINVLFSPEHILLYDQWVNKGNYPGGPGSRGSSNNGLVITEYQTAMQYVEQIKVMFGKQHTAKWHKEREILEIMPPPKQCGVGMIALYKRTEAEYLYNNRLVKKLAIARCKEQWGLHIRKYGVTLPDGITINGDPLISEGREDADKWYEEIRKESAPPDFMVG